MAFCHSQTTTALSYERIRNVTFWIPPAFTCSLAAERETSITYGFRVLLSMKSILALTTFGHGTLRSVLVIPGDRMPADTAGPFQSSSTPFKALVEAFSMEIFTLTGSLDGLIFSVLCALLPQPTTAIRARRAIAVRVSIKGFRGRRSAARHQNVRISKIGHPWSSCFPRFPKKPPMKDFHRSSLTLGISASGRFASH